jgi:hypothetical protein
MRPLRRIPAEFSPAFSFATSTLVLIRIFLACLVLAVSQVHTARAQVNAADANSAVQVTKAVGTIKTTQSDSIVVASESGGDVTAKISESTKILRVPPGEKDLKNAVPLLAQDLQAGDRVLVRGQTMSDAHTLAALAIIVMKQSDLAAKKRQQSEDWQKRGAGGLVTKVDAGNNVITISSSGLGASRSITVRINKDSVLRRYAPGSVKFDDAKPLAADKFMAEIKTGDQLRARGASSADGAGITAEEIVSGSFRNIAGTIKAVDASNNTITVQDAISKSEIIVSVSRDSQMKKLAPDVAQRIAVRLKAASGDGSASDEARPTGQAQATSNRRTPTPTQAADAGGAQSTAGGRARGSGSGSGGLNGPPDLQRMLSRLPNSTLADFKAGDAVMIVATEGVGSEKPTAITLLAGVEPILTASPNRSASSLLSPWSLSAPSGEAEATP